ncbi:SpoIIE family protein phosphatase [Terasakiella sp. SH-1]|uniref:PP2C family protein-serine/threonine phosphatase n=1 Tax=Terasakiella sp. SH-1 TaxID=2560057 RepID=UPI00107337E6|nr:SpoIIE family protein phosphatase [Terasakiella sp. SH-1]
MVKILCIEDEKDLRRDICEELRDNDYDVIEASNGAQGLDLIRTEMPDLVLCDIRMPIMDGYELLDTVRNSYGQWANVPFLFLTAFGEREDVLKGLSCGADDYLTKPIDYDMLIARVVTVLRQVNRVTQQVKNDQREMQKELNRAHAMQRDLLPSEEKERLLERAYNLTISSHYEPSTELGGDIWGMHLMSPSKVMFYLVDFSGHGIAAAMNTFRLHSKIDSEPIGEMNPAEYLMHLNEWLSTQLQTGQYATITLGVIDLERHVFEYAAAGSTTPIRLDHQKQKIELGSGKGIPLGLSAKAKYENRTMEFNKGDGIFLYSDALIEHGRKEGLSLGRDGVEMLALEALY